MNLPFWSTLTLLTELGITASVYFIIWRAYTRGTFFWLFATAVLLYETFFNISYMFSRVDDVGRAVSYSPSQIGLAIFHGTFSIIMFAALVVFFVVAGRAYKRGVNYFAQHRTLTTVFVVAWGISILSGVIFFASLYLF